MRNYFVLLLIRNKRFIFTGIQWKVISISPLYWQEFDWNLFSFLENQYTFQGLLFSLLFQVYSCKVTVIEIQEFNEPCFFSETLQWLVFLHWILFFILVYSAMAQYHLSVICIVTRRPGPALIVLKSGGLHSVKGRGQPWHKNVKESG